MGCLSANAQLIRDTADVGASIDRDDISVSAVVESERIEVGAELKRDKVSTSAEVSREPLKAKAGIHREKIDISASTVCTLGGDNSLWASDGVLYDGNSQPIFTTEKWEN